MSRLTRREFLKEGVLLSGVAGAVLYVDPALAWAANPDQGMVWDKAPCRFCGTGCSVMVGVKEGKIAAVKGDPKSSVNQGTLCVKGYSLPSICYGSDRVIRPMIRKRDGNYDKHGELTPASWDEALDLMAEKAQAALQAKGPAGVALFTSGQSTVWEGYAASKLWKGGLGSNSLECNAPMLGKPSGEQPQPSRSVSWPAGSTGG